MRRERNSAVATIVLAAGESRRLGQPKQLLRWGRGTLIEHAVEVALAARLGSVLVVLGAKADAVRSQINGCNATLVTNEFWQEGIHTSIRCGIEAREKFDPHAGAAILMTCDQPCLLPENLKSLSSIFYSASLPAVASSYAGSLGTPALFSNALFGMLKALRRGGAKKVLQELGAAVASCPFENGEIDLDTQEDVERFTAMNLA